MLPSSEVLLVHLDSSGMMNYMKRRCNQDQIAPQKVDHGAWEFLRIELLRRMDDLWEDFFGEMSQLWEELGARVYTRLDTEQEFQIEAGEGIFPGSFCCS